MTAGVLIVSPLFLVETTVFDAKTCSKLGPNVFVSMTCHSILRMWPAERKTLTMQEWRALDSYTILSLLLSLNYHMGSPCH